MLGMCPQEYLGHWAELWVCGQHGGWRRTLCVAKVQLQASHVSLCTSTCSHVWRFEGPQALNTCTCRNSGTTAACQVRVKGAWVTSTERCTCSSFTLIATPFQLCKSTLLCCLNFVKQHALALATYTERVDRLVWLMTCTGVCVF